MLHAPLSNVREQSASAWRLPRGCPFRDALPRSYETWRHFRDALRLFCVILLAFLPSAMLEPTVLETFRLAPGYWDLLLRTSGRH
jgi:hypothetical protein